MPWTERRSKATRTTRDGTATVARYRIVRTPSTDADTPPIAIGIQ